MSRRIAPALALALLLGLAPAIASAQAAGPDSATRAREEQARMEAAKRRELEEIQQQARENREQATKLKGRESQTLGQLRRTQRELNLTRRRLRALAHRRGALDAQLGVTRATLHRTQLSLDQQKARLAARLRNMFKAGADRELEFLLSTRSFAQLLARWDFLVMVAEQDRVLLEDIEGKKEQIQTTQQRLQADSQEVRAVERQTTVQNRKLDQLRSQREQQLTQIRTQRRTYEAAAAELEKTARDIQRLLARLERQRQAEEQRRKAGGRAPEPYTGDFAKARKQLEWPVEGKIVGSFGPERHPRFGTTTLNNGIDIAAPLGTPVRAVARGRVDFTSDDFAAFGQVIVVNHGDGFYTLYGHLSDILVRQGQEVQPGQEIGRVGESGTSLKGTVLHFEVRKGGSALDPEDWLK
ncbi:MAG TPA: peptidoglycan DD-metalloendopeptidase family protein [Terriglobales bacterium]|nr:peptidoglycan DD-metalloendopeptidase family protein [Terriglobales bacterium]